MGCFCPIQCACLSHIPGPLLASTLRTILAAPPPNTNRPLPSSPAHNITFSFLSRMTACPSEVASAGPRETVPHRCGHPNQSLLRLICTFVVGVRLIYIQIGIGFDLSECDGAAQLVRARQVYECNPGPMPLPPLGDFLARQQRTECAVRRRRIRGKEDVSLGLLSPLPMCGDLSLRARPTCRSPFFLSSSRVALFADFLFVTNKDRHLLQFLAPPCVFCH
ncbi:hypothetical protein B0H13DRAFT_2394770 [Mycena leptocephala]|nr:hypothetical protein B0H13DRAFT_2394770 [Mycena leptocephala]